MSEGETSERVGRAPDRLHPAGCGQEGASLFRIGIDDCVGQFGV